MRVDIIKIGNSKGVRIPKAFLEQCGMQKTVELTIKHHSLVITPYKDPREGWEESFQRMAKHGDDVLLDSDHSLSSWDDDEWEW